MKAVRHQARFPNRINGDPANVLTLDRNHPAMREMRSMFPSRAFGADEVDRLLISGINSRKTGRKVTKGPWRGMPIYTLTLEERATCPATCSHLADCYGNSSHLARRIRHGFRFEYLLIDEVFCLAAENRNGLVVRLHVLGDFYSAHYVDMWTEFLRQIPQLHVFGYTARLEGEIHAAIVAMNDCFPDRCAIRFSSDSSRAMGATVIQYHPVTARVEEGLVCPAETGRTRCCAECALCWSPAMRGETIVFIRHGNPGRPKTSRHSAVRHIPVEAYQQ